MSKLITALMLSHNCNSQIYFCNFTNLQLYFVITICGFCDFDQTIYALASRNFRKKIKTIHFNLIIPFSSLINTGYYFTVVVNPLLKRYFYEIDKLK